MTEPTDCTDCKWVNTGTYDEPNRRTVTQPCPRHQPPPTPLQEARAEVEEIAAAWLEYLT